MTVRSDNPHPRSDAGHRSFSTTEIYVRETEMGKGTVFTIRLPACDAKPERRAA